MRTHWEGVGPTVEAAGELRDKNQITIARPIIEALGARSGDRFLFVVRNGEENVVHLHRLRESYAGVLGSAYGISEETRTYLEGERASWEE